MCRTFSTPASYSLRRCFKRYHPKKGTLLPAAKKEMNTPRFCDFHLHTSFSTDSEAPMEEMIAGGIQRGLDVMCFTDHLDLDFPSGNKTDYQLNMKSYPKAVAAFREQYADQIDLRFGIELGLQRHLGEPYRRLLSALPFDFAIGSTHIVDGPGPSDPYYREFWQERTEKEALRHYFETTLAYIQSTGGYQVYGHLDYAVRYAPNKNSNYSYENYRDILEEILRTLIEKGIGIELNTGGYRSGLGVPNPCPEILARYRELGGEILTIGSDAHSPEYLGWEFPKAYALLKSLGYTHYTIFKDQKPEFLALP